MGNYVIDFDSHDEDELYSDSYKSEYERGVNIAKMCELLSQKGTNYLPFTLRSEGTKVYIQTRKNARMDNDEIKMLENQANAYCHGVRMVLEEIEKAEALKALHQKHK